MHNIAIINNSNKIKPEYHRCVFYHNDNTLYAKTKLNLYSNN